LKSLSNQISKTLDLIIKHATEVITHETAARQAAQSMEEASLKAQLARKNMIAVSCYFNLVFSKFYFSIFILESSFLFFNISKRIIFDALKKFNEMLFLFLIK
jgi:hypothetical protein